MTTKAKTISREFTINISSVGRNLSDDDWEYIDQNFIECWKAARSLLSTHKYQFESNEYSLEMNWNPALRNLQHNFRVMKKLDVAIGFRKYLDAPKEYEGILGEFRTKNIKIPCKVVIRQNSKSKLEEYTSRIIVENYVHDVFLIMNFAAPGSLDLYRSKIVSKNDKSQSEFSLSNFLYESAFLNRVDRKWPAPNFLQLKEVCKWYFDVRSGYLQLPQSRMEKVLFGIFQASASNLSPTTIIWQFNILETLYDTKAGQNFSVLIDRICLLLSPTESELKKMRKNLRAMYDLRSSLVHGGLDIIHPMAHDSLDPTVEKQYIRIMDLASFGFSLVLVSMQEVISRNISELQFNEVLDGKSL